ncbi:protein ALTERED PHOSPHATE STARVATION RESPONSE 1 isoform X1 [Ziziphus jujuba]|uniref:Protein ALTERED PHOSPHATE STARVATION RESPONSE 1 isoform X1 n=1 Tax=Ziziphus jujuba TaxID=326968 RepID=A0A6P3ZJW3_ZIZJJ|nr:protein ALTERED PHOSPHATE STARVATION RESPONSE 1 isoform X1 [Ziziphus jujuba]
MGCVASRIDKEERVQVFKERKKLMKQLVVLRGEFADSQFAYLRALKNTGVTLRQFTESESLELESTHHYLALPPSPPPPPPPLPPPPPPPPFSPDLRKSDNNQRVVGKEESTEISVGDTSADFILNSAWDFLKSSSPQNWERHETGETVDEENWAETKTDFEEEQEGEDSIDIVSKPLPGKSQPPGLADDNSSTMSRYTKDTAELAMVSLRSKKSLEGIAKELDDYFLKASGGVKEIAVLMDITGRDKFLTQSSQDSKRYNSAKVVSALSRSRSDRLTRDAVEPSGASEPCRPGAHSITLGKLCAEEKNLYKYIKEAENQDWTKTEKTRLNVEHLEGEISRLQQLISKTCSSILNLIDDELYPQLVALTFGLLHLWRTMNDCHQAQFHISQQLDHLTDNQRMDLSTDYRRQAAAQLETEVNCWFNSFCKFVKSQQDYVRALCRWIRLTGRLVDEQRQSLYSSAVHSFSDQWQLALDKLPDKVASEAIKSLWSAIHLIRLQQEEERNLQRKYGKIEKKLQKEQQSLSEMKGKLEGSFAVEDVASGLSPKHPLSLKHAKIEALTKQVEMEKSKYLNSVQVSNTMTLNNLKTSLPNLFLELTGFCRDYIAAIEGSFNHIKPADPCDGA